MPTVKERTAHQAVSPCFAEVELDVTPNERGPMSVELAPDAEASEGDWYLPAIRVGVELALRLARDTRRSSARVVVRRIRTTKVDSNEMVVLYTAARATLRALDADPDLAGTLDRVSRTLTIPY